jgi:cell division protein FtsQ
MSKKKKRKNNRKIVKKKKQKRIKIKFGRIFLALLIVFLIFYLISNLCKFPIKNIFISGNESLTDQEIIDIASLSNYPSIFKYTNNEIEKKLEKNIYIKKAKVKKKKLKEVYIEIEENKILFYNKSSKKTILSNGITTDKELSGPILINYVPDKIYKKLIQNMDLIDNDILNRISEIKYDPSNVDEERFLFTMNDGNYVYITLEKIETINSYVEISLEIINKFGKKNGVLNLDAGEYFEIIND